jgi:hypothetical protein
MFLAQLRIKFLINWYCIQIGKQARKFEQMINKKSYLSSNYSSIKELSVRVGIKNK